MENLKIKKEPRRQRILAVRLSPEEFSRIEKLCKDQDISYSRLIRFSIEEILKMNKLSKK